jgi:hypothetical protein
MAVTHVHFEMYSRDEEGGGDDKEKGGRERVDNRDEVPSGDSSRREHPQPLLCVRCQWKECINRIK